MGCCGGDSKTKASGQKPEKPTKKFEYNGPTRRGDAYALFADGIGYRVVKGKEWYIYNDSIDREVHIHFTFGPDNKVSKPRHARTEVKKQPSKWTECKLVVYPLETVPFVKFGAKEVNGFRAYNVAKPLTAGYIDRVNREAVSKYQKEARAVAGVAGQTHNDEELLYKCRKSKIRYVDTSFPPGQLSVRRPTDKKQVNNLSLITWMRPQDYIPDDLQKKINLFHNGIEPSDIGQGQLGDCWLMCSIAVVAESESMIEAMFRHPVSSSKLKKEQKAGAYRVYINKCGLWRNIIVDSYLPTYNGTLYFGRSARDPFELWVSLLEKAYAKVHGSYASIIGGNALHALQDLTGFPTFSFNETWKAAMKDEETAKTFFKDLLRYRKKGYLLTIGTPGTDTSAYNVGASTTNDASFEERYRKAGLCTGHAYSVLTVRQFSMPNIKLLKIRNPWGQGIEWTGAWSRGDPKWKKHPFVRRSCKPSTKSDGTFWMEWKDAVQYFDGGGVCMVRKKWFDYRFHGQFVDVYPTFALKIELTKPQKIFFTLSQSDRRMLAPDDPQQLYKGFLIAVSNYNAELKTQEVVAISTASPETHPAETFTFTVARDIGLEMELDPLKGPYYVVPRIMAANRAGPKDFTLGMLTPNECKAKGLRVSFVRLPQTCPIFKSVKKFSTDGESQIQMQFQFKKRKGVPQLREGTSAFDAEKVKEDFPFPY